MLCFLFNTQTITKEFAGKVLGPREIAGISTGFSRLTPRRIPGRQPSPWIQQGFDRDLTGNPGNSQESAGISPGREKNCTVK
jgi:hypothetical protein